MTTLTESTIRSFASEQSFERGREYYHSGAIYNTYRQGNHLAGRVRRHRHLPSARRTR